MTTRYVRVSDCLDAEVGESTVVLVPSSSMDFVELDDIGTAIWSALATHSTASAIATSLLDEYEVDLATLEADVADYLERLVALGMVTRDD